MNRRHFIKAAALAPFAGSVLLSRGMHLLNPKYKFAIATYSYWHFREPKVTVQEVIDHAANLGAQGVDVLHVQMDNESPEYLKFLRKHANDKGVELICLSIHQDSWIRIPRKGIVILNTQNGASRSPTTLA